MTDAAVSFDDGLAYENFMGRWSREIGTIFLDWLDVPKGAQWLDIGCGTGVLTELLFETRSPAAVAAIDPAGSQIDYARVRLGGRRANIYCGNAQALPFSADAFDVVVSGLVINFIPDRFRALREMRRVCRPGGCIAGYVWDFAGERSAGWPLRVGLRRIGVEPPEIPGVASTDPETLHRLFSKAGLEEIDVKPIDVTLTYPSFDDYWRSQTPSFTPQGKLVSTLPKEDRLKLVEAVRTILPDTSEGGFAYSARANAIKSRTPE